MATSSSTAFQILSTIDACVEDRHLLKHPFYQAWTAGTLSLEALENPLARAWAQFERDLVPER